MDERGGDERDAREGERKGQVGEERGEARSNRGRGTIDREIAGEAADGGGREGRTLKSSRQTLMVASGERAFRRGGVRRAL